MLHWNSWWIPSDEAATRATGEPPLLPHDLTEWTPEGWLAWQCKLWSRSFEASLAWWKLYGVAFPSMPWPPLYTPVTIVHEAVASASVVPVEVPMVLEPGSEPPRARRPARRARPLLARPKASPARRPPA